jgi:hypothetical protein
MSSHFGNTMGAIPEFLVDKKQRDEVEGYSDCGAPRIAGLRLGRRSHGCRGDCEPGKYRIGPNLAPHTDDWEQSKCLDDDNGLGERPCSSKLDKNKNCFVPFHNRSPGPWVSV